MSFAEHDNPLGTSGSPTPRFLGTCAYGIKHATECKQNGIPFMDLTESRPFTTELADCRL